MLDRQKFVNTAVKGLASQGFIRAGRMRWESDSDDPDDFLCMYKDYEGNRCAIGWTIPDEVAKDHPSIFSSSGGAQGLMITYRDYTSYWGFEGGDVYFASALQLVHDRSLTPVDMKSRLVKFCIDHMLDIPADICS